MTDQDHERASTSLQRFSTSFDPHFFLTSLLSPLFCLHTDESSSEAHQLYRSKPGHSHHSKGKAPHVVPGVVPPGSTGVLYVSERATANGFTAGSPEVRHPDLSQLFIRLITD